jgi:hypothetical protein
MPGPSRYYFEDIEVGTVVETPAMTLTQAHVTIYAGLTDDVAPPGRVPDLLPLCLTIGLGWRVNLRVADERPGAGGRHDPQPLSHRRQALDA